MIPLQNINQILSAAIAYFLIIMISGFMQAWIAKKLGDETAARLGFLSLNPAIYIDWIGLMLFLITGFGWGKIVPINPHNFSGTYKRLELIFTYASRPFVNGMLALMTLVILDTCLGGYALLLPKLSFFAQHVALAKALKGVLTLMTTFGIFFTLFSGILAVFRALIMQWVGRLNISWHEAELASTLLAAFLLIFFSQQIQYLIMLIVIHIELFVWYWWYTIAQFFGFLSWYV